MTIRDELREVDVGRCSRKKLNRSGAHGTARRHFDTPPSFAACFAVQRIALEWSGLDGIAVRWLLRCCALLLVAASTVAAEPLRAELAELDGEFSPERAGELDFRPYSPGTPAGVGGDSSRFVLRVWPPPAGDSNRSRNLILRPHYLWHVTGWFKAAGREHWQKTVVGRLLPPSARYYSTRDHVFEIDDDLDAAAPVYLVVRDNRSPKPVQVSWVDRREYLIADVAFSRIIATAYGMTFIMALANLLFYFFIREKPFLFYSVYMLLSLNGMIWQEGWIGRFVTLDATVGVDRALRLCAVLPMVAYFSFFRSYLGLDTRQWAGRFFIVVQLVLGGLLATSLSESFILGSYSRPVWITLGNGTLAVGAIGVFIITLTSWLRGNRLALYLFVANLILVTATLMRVYEATTFGIDNDWMNHAFEIALAIDAVLLSVAVANRTLSIRRERDRARADLERIDSAYQREQLVADFVSQARAIAVDPDISDPTDLLDELMVASIRRLVDVREVVVLTREGATTTWRSLGGDTVIDRLASHAASFDPEELLARCSPGEVTSIDLPEVPDTTERFGGLLISVRYREQVESCTLLIVPATSRLDPEAMYGLRDFIEKTARSRLDAENVHRLQRSAQHDDLTGALNRASMEARVTALLNHCTTTGRALALAFVDIDHFKALNDTRGHDFGDHCLRVLCSTLRETLPPDAAIGRFGGDEFLIALPGIDTAGAAEILGRLNTELEKATAESGAGLSVSVGIAEHRPGKQITMERLVRRADRSLYAAKSAGRARISTGTSNESNADHS